jgi:hypothetical protein
MESSTIGETERTQLFWGVYATSPMPRVKGTNVDLYYFGLDRRDAPFAQARAQEHRHTVGIRLFGNRTGFDLDEEIFNFDSRRSVPDVESKFDWDVERAESYLTDYLITLGCSPSRRLDNKIGRWFKTGR